MFSDTQPTPLDLRFRLFAFPVRVSPWYWVSMALLGESVWRVLGAAYLLLWMLCGFASILAHELGHAFLIRWFGSPSRIVLYAFGGLAINEYPPRQAWKRLLIACGGPIANFLLFGFVVASDALLLWGAMSPILAHAYSFFVIINIFWALFNLLPIWPMDGGKITRELFVILGLRRAEAMSLLLSTICAAALCGIGILYFIDRVPPEIDAWIPYRPGLFTTVFMGMLAFESYTLWQQANRRVGWEDPDDLGVPWRRN